MDEPEPDPPMERNVLVQAKNHGLAAAGPCLLLIGGVISAIYGGLLHPQMPLPWVSCYSEFWRYGSFSWALFGQANNIGHPHVLHD
jgi:hypothetical protein